MPKSLWDNWGGEVGYAIIISVVIIELTSLGMIWFRINISHFVIFLWITILVTFEGQK
jgi:hypothetical protein